MRILSTTILAFGLLNVITLPTSAQSNTLVRFRTSYGSHVLGNIDVELFDQDKPVTVANFLAYVDSGRYKRTFFHRLIPGFVIQGGSGNIINPYSGALFQIVNAMLKDAPITNEANVDPHWSNLFGTLAMARTPDPNSATSEWFFNLGNNSTNLDTQTGGFTVFGRVIAGTNLLGYFNSFTRDHGIVDISDPSYYFSCGTFAYVYENGFYYQFEDTDLPVAFFENSCVRYLDLLTVDVFRLNKSSTDTESPTVTISSPAADAAINNSDVAVTGTASDLVGVASVDVILNHERLTVAAGGANWSVTVTNVPPGTNTLTVVAIDPNGNQSLPTFQNFFQRTQTKLVLTNSGLGSVRGPANGQFVDQNVNYSFVATPVSGYVFRQWKGSFAFGGGSRTRTDPNLIAYFYPGTNAWLWAEFAPRPDAPQLELQWMTGYPTLSLHGMVGSNYTVQYATSLDLPSWNTLRTITNLTLSPFQFRDDAGALESARFYRALMK